MNTFYIDGDLHFLEFYRIGTQIHLGFIPWANNPESLCGLTISGSHYDLKVMIDIKNIPLDKLCLKCIARERDRRY